MWLDSESRQKGLLCRKCVIEHYEYMWDKDEEEEEFDVR